jgi:hypothetical protein
MDFRMQLHQRVGTHSDVFLSDVRQPERIPTIVLDPAESSRKFVQEDKFKNQTHDFY